MNTVRIGEKPLNLTYTHSRGDNRTILDGTLVFDPSNKFSANYMLGTDNCKLKYTYVHKGMTTFEPVYDFAKNSWDFAVSRRVYGDDSLKASYQSSSKILGLEWSRNSKHNGCFKVNIYPVICCVGSLFNFFPFTSVCAFGSVCSCHKSLVLSAMKLTRISCHTSLQVWSLSSLEEFIEPWNVDMSFNILGMWTVK